MNRIPDDSPSGRASVAGTGRPVTPGAVLAPVKRDLGILLVLAFPVWVGAERGIAEPGLRALVLGAFGGLAAAWVALRARRVLRHLARRGEG